HAGALILAVLPLSSALVFGDDGDVAAVDTGLLQPIGRPLGALAVVEGAQHDLGHCPPPPGLVSPGGGSLFGGRRGRHAPGGSGPRRSRKGCSTGATAAIANRPGSSMRQASRWIWPAST